MRVTKLTIQAFGPFKEREVIEFNNFGKDGIFLISGDTGSGKTSIFDAISYALFGKSSGGERLEDELRYSAANPDEETFVELEFEYKNKPYKIRRSPKYKRFKKNSITETTDKHKTSLLTLPSGEEIDGIKEVDNYINELLNISKDQFNHIAMLAQGKFSEFLKASSFEKMNIFRDIFQTMNYQKLEDNIASKLRDKKDEYKLLENTKNEIISNFMIPEEVYEQFSENKKLGVNYLVEFIEKYNNDTAEGLKTISKKLIEKEEKLNLAKEKFKKIEEYHNNKKQLLDKTKKFESIALDFENSKKEFEMLKAKDEEIENLIKNEDRLQKELEKFNSLQNIQNQIEKIEETIINSRKKIEEKELEIEEINKNISEINTFINKNKNIREEKIKLENNYEKLVNAETELQDLKLIIKERDEKEKLLNDFLPKYETIKREFSILNNEMNRLEDIYFESQAGILAKTLKNNDPCPVCGSTDHPNPAKYHDEIPDKDKIDAMKKDLDLKVNEKNEIHGEIKVISSGIESIRKSITKSLERKGIVESDIISEFDRIKKEKSEVEILLEKSDNTITKLEEKELEKSELSSSLDTAKNEYSNLTQSLKVEQSNFERLRSEEEKEKESLGDRNLESLKDEIVKNKEIIEQSRIYVDKVRENYTELSTEYTSLNTEINIIKNSIQEDFNLDKEEVSEKIQDLQNEFTELKNNESSLKFAFETNKNQVNRLKSISKEISVQEDKINNISEINDVLKGSIKGIANIKFETFVQSRFFDQLIAVSNKRFYDMTEGKYSLRRKTQAQNMGKQFGLDFEVIDHQNKTNRNINTLSGGESFQASLSLALGLSDIVSMNVGAIQIDSMFIDEGFGTLDGDTLAKVMSTLSKISSKNKLVGIISHVDQLKEQIDKQVHVEKTNDGYSKIVKQIF